MENFPGGVVIPPDSILESIERNYGPLAEAVPCGFCGTPHKKGYVVIFRKSPAASPERAIMGHHCGKKFFGEAWQKVQLTYQSKLEDKKSRELLDKSLKELPTFQQRLEKVNPKIRRSHTLKRLLGENAPLFMRRCREACRSDNGYLRRYRYTETSEYQLRGRSFFLDENLFYNNKSCL